MRLVHLWHFFPRFQYICSLRPETSLYKKLKRLKTKIKRYPLGFPWSTQEDTFMTSLRFPMEVATLIAVSKFLIHQWAPLDLPQFWQLFGNCSNLGSKQRERFLIYLLSIYSYLKHILDKLLKNLFFIWVRAALSKERCMLSYLFLKCVSIP